MRRLESGYVFFLRRNRTSSALAKFSPSSVETVAIEVALHAVSELRRKHSLHFPAALGAHHKPASPPGIIDMITGVESDFRGNRAAPRNAGARASGLPATFHDLPAIWSRHRLLLLRLAARAIGRSVHSAAVKKIEVRRTILLSSWAARPRLWPTPAVLPAPQADKNRSAYNFPASRQTPLALVRYTSSQPRTSTHARHFPMIAAVDASFDRNRTCPSTSGSQTTGLPAAFLDLPAIWSPDIVLRSRLVQGMVHGEPPYLSAVSP